MNPMPPVAMEAGVSTWTLLRARGGAQCVRRVTMA